MWDLNQQKLEFHRLSFGSTNEELVIYNILYIYYKYMICIIYNYIYILLVIPSVEGGSHGQVACYLLTKKADPQKADREGNSPLHFACASGCAPLVAELLKRKAGVEPSGWWNGMTGCEIPKLSSC